MNFLNWENIMKVHKLNGMVRGWFVGNFHPAAFVTDTCEVAIKKYQAGDSEPKHCHAQATELTTVIDGIIEMNGQIFAAGDIVTIEKNEYCKFRCIEDAITVVFKSTSVTNDKFTA